MAVLALFRSSFQIHKVASDVAADVTLNTRKAKRETFTMCFNSLCAIITTNDDNTSAWAAFGKTAFKWCLRICETDVSACTSTLVVHRQPSSVRLRSLPPLCPPLALLLRRCSLPDSKRRETQNRAPSSSPAGIKGRAGGSVGSPCWTLSGCCILLQRYGALLIPAGRPEARSHSSLVTSRICLDVQRPTMSVREKRIQTKDSVSLLPCFYFVEVSQALLCTSIKRYSEDVIWFDRIYIRAALLYTSLY